MSYRHLFGALLYAGGNRPDIKGALAVLGRFLHNPGTAHWKSLKRVLVYLYTTRDRELCLGRGIKDSILDSLTIFVDADHGGCADTKRSTSGVVTVLRGSTIDCVSRRQGSVSNSTAASELKAMQVACHKAMVLDFIFTELGYDVKPIRIKTDSQVLVDMLARKHLKTNTKHLALSFAEVLECVTNGLVAIVHVAGVNNRADLLTKPLPRVTFEKHRDALLNDIEPVKPAASYPSVLQD